ncbi:MAG: ThuA domain-containing protein [Alistipes sp.]|jgi:type 1 glutamine amidotransferase|nr:ThuA domain-containing protein [Alistipes sp.]
MNRITKICAVALIALAATFQSFAQDSPLKGKRVLYIYGGWDGHEPVQCRDIFVPWMESEGAIVQAFDNLDPYTDTTIMNHVDLIIQQWTMGTITRQQERGLLNAVRRGVGLAGWHGGTGDAFRNNVEFQYMVGGQWVAHPGGVIDYRVNIIDHEDPVTAGLTDFDMHSEQYFVHVDPNVKVMATTTYTGEQNFWLDGAVAPIVWKKQYGNGRVFYNALGHVAADFAVPQALEMMKRGIRWASESLEKGPEPWLSPAYKTSK